MLKRNRIISFCTSIIVLSSLYSINVYAAPAQVSTDEAVYANLDYYGNISDMSVVKGVSLNGNNQFTDYGEYTNVINMSNYVEPQLNDNSVTWNMDDSNLKERFYYECIPKSNDIEIPWNFDVSYKLNGVPQDAEDIAGKSGLVEITVKAVPNENVSDYYKNNMMLQVICLINMDETLSIEAPGAQMQSVGTYKGIVFFGLPGEESTFEMRIGTDSFESSGIEMTMIPGRTDQLKQIKDIREAKDTVKDSLDSINESLNSVFNTFGSMSDGLGEIKTGLNELNESREKINDSTDETYESTDELIKKLDQINNEINTILPYFTSTAQFITDMNSDTNDIVNTALELHSQIDKYKTSIDNIKSSITKYQRMVNKLSGLEDDTHDVFDELKDELDDLEYNTEDISDKLNKIKKDIEVVSDNVDDIESKIKDIYSRVENEMIKNAVEKSISACEDLKDKLNKLSNGAKDIEDIVDSGSSISGTLKDVIEVGEKYYDAVNNQSDNTRQLLSELKKILNTTSDTLDTADKSVQNVQSLDDTADAYYDDCISVVKLTQNLSGSINNAVIDTSKLIGAIEKLIRSNQEKLNFSTKDTLDALVSLIDKGIDLTDDSDTLNDSNNTIKNTLDDQIDKIEDGSNVLNMDYEESLKSFTSDENPSPQSVQIIMRTEEITVDDDNESNEDFENEENNDGIINRIISIFKKIWQSL
ncbi:hypothetical protein [uncultured Clostridium sp.]|uniref:hypothetical protein n=1 Tax=uncultured Clostridium sp. TaxID=59620 RepID=UPI0025CCCB3F|nr:hypothetical protein [uncultured Clostridium sp.]